MFGEDVREFIDWARSRRAASVEVPTASGPLKISFREPSNAEIAAQIEAQMTAAERAAFANMSDDQKLKYEQEERERLLYGSA